MLVSHELIDLTGKRFGHLVVLKRSKKIRSYPTWECLCDCGNIIIRRGQSLREGKTTHCGCLRYPPPGIAGFNRVVNDLIQTARTRKLELSLSKEQIKELVTQPCYYCGSEPTIERTAKTILVGFVRNGIDRIDNTKGYIPGNCVPCCYICNRAKGTMLFDDFISWAKKLSIAILGRSNKNG